MTYSKDNPDVPVIIHSREWLINVVQQAITANNAVIESVKRKRAIAESVRKMDLADLRQRRAMLLWVRDDVIRGRGVPENIQINRLGKDVTPDE